jgi:hypothetical protein
MPALTPTVDNLDKVPEAARPFYEQRDGKYHVILDAPPAGYVAGADHAAANAKVVEFRDKNIALLQEVEPLRVLKTQFAGVDPEKAKTAISEVEALKAKGVTKPDDIAAQIQAAVQAAVKPLQEQLATGTAETAAERKRGDELTLRNVIGEKFTKAGGRPDAVEFIIGKAQTAFKVEAGTVKALPNKFSAEKPGEPLGIEEWIIGLAKDNAFAFEPSQGSGAAPVKGSGSGARPGQTILKDPTPQQLGDHSKDILAGKVRVEYSK